MFVQALIIKSLFKERVVYTPKAVTLAGVTAFFYGFKEINRRGLLLSLLALVALAADEAPDASSKGGAYEWAYDENPEIGDSSATLEYGGSDGTCGVDAGAGVTDAYEVHEHE